MSKFKNFLSILSVVGRYYSTPISIISWTIPFLYSLTVGGNLIYGLIALIGIFFIQMGVNSFDDIFDFIKENSAIKKGLKDNFDFQEGKCQYLIDKTLTLKQYALISFLYFGIGTIVGIFFLNIYGVELLKIIIPSAILCILYPLCSYIGLGEIVVGIIYAPLLYLGVNYVMCGYYDFKVLVYSISTALLTIAILHNHMLLDFKIDTSSRKLTFCRILKTEKKALAFLICLIAISYINIINIIKINNHNIIYLLPLLSLPNAYILIKEMSKHIKDKVEITKEEFLKKFLLPQKLLATFSILLGIALILDKII